MREIHQVGSRWKIESVYLEKLADTYGTPLYVYSREAIVYAWKQWRNAITQLPCAKEADVDQPQHKNRPVLSYAVKANSNLSILRLLNELGAGFDVVSGGEIERVLAAGGRPKQIVFSGVGKTESELDLACTYNIACINIESEFEFEALQRVLASSARAVGNPIDVAVRINPGVDAGTHAYITTGTGADKFGLAPDLALDLARRIDASDSMRFAGLVSHIGSQIFNVEPYAQTLSALLDNALKLHKMDVVTPVLGLGGGWGVSGTDEPGEAKLKDLTTALAKVLLKHPFAKKAALPALAFEPGRSIVAEAGLLLTRVIGLKKQPERNFAVVDAAMNDYIRPALYNAGTQVLNISTSQSESSAGKARSGAGKGGSGAGKGGSGAGQGEIDAGQGGSGAGQGGIDTGQGESGAGQGESDAGQGGIDTGQGESGAVQSATDEGKGTTDADQRGPGADQDEHCDVVGPVCESGDFLAKDCLLSVRKDDILAILDTGAYGFSMGSNYNSRPRPAEVLIDEKQVRIIRERESVGEMLAAETRCLRDDDPPPSDDDDISDDE